MAAGMAGRAIRFLREKGIRRFVRKVWRKLPRMYEEKHGYENFLKTYGTTEEELERQRAENFSDGPSFSIVVPMYRTRREFLKELIDSVMAQTYQNWQLCLADGSETDELGGFVRECCGGDARVCYRHLAQNGGISENTNSALAMAKGDYIVFADHDDLLAEEALYQCAKVVREDSAVDCIYSDEDKVDMDGSHYFMPHFKPDFNIDLLCSHNYITHLFVVKRALQEQVGGLRGEYDGSQDHDMVLRCVEQAEKVFHIPKILYHWRCHVESTAMDPESKLYCYESGRRAVQAHYDRLGIPAEVRQDDHYGFYRTFYRWEERPEVSVIVLDGDDYSAEANEAARQSKGEYLLFLDRRVAAAGETEEAVAHMQDICMRPDVGAVGAKIIYPNDTVRHSGIILQEDTVAGFPFRGMDYADDGYFFRNISLQDLSAVSGECLMTGRSDFLAAGGFDEDLCRYQDVDYCLRLRRAGKLVVYTPFARWIYDGRPSGGNAEAGTAAKRQAQESAQRMRKRWAKELAADPCYNPNLNTEKCDYTIRKPLL